ncbi:MAG: tRNA dimethylallyltransferase [Bradymonadia bacterium]|jgi:tRNA dimethylallyltransferase
MTPLVCIVGPTAVGKTALAVGLARRWSAEIVGCDASQVHRGMDIGTGKATAEDLGDVRHHLLDVIDPGAHFDAVTYAGLADAAIAGIFSRGKRVIVCGGTGLYLRALVQGLSKAPPSDPEVQSTLRARIANGELSVLHAELGEVDPQSAARLPPTDTQRIERALSVYLTTGRSLTDWHAEHAAAPPRYPATTLRLECPRDVLGARIQARVEAMFAAGLVDEVRGLLDRGIDPSHKSMAALGYRPVARHVLGEISLPQAMAETVLRSRQYAKRQMTWFKRLPYATSVQMPTAPADLDATLKNTWGQP